MTKTWDVIIIGSGAAGLTAGMFAARRGLTVLIITKDIGGQTSTTAEIENYPGIGQVEGPLLMEEFRIQASAFGCEIRLGSFRGLTKGETRFCVETSEGAHDARTIILAFGKTPRKLGVKGEDEYVGKGIYSSTPPVAAQYRGKCVAVIGGGNSAVQSATLLDGIAQRVYLIHRRDVLTAEQVLLDRFASCVRTEFIPSYAVVQVIGGERVSSLILESALTHEHKELAIDGVFVHTGYELNTQHLPEWIEKDSGGRVVVSAAGETSCPGVFAAGDLTTVPYQQIIISAGEGAKAALSAYHYLCKRDGTRARTADWGFVARADNSAEEGYTTSIPTLTS